MEQTKLRHPLENEEKVIDINELSLLCTAVHLRKLAREKTTELETNF